MRPSIRRRIALVAVVAAALSFGYGAGWPDVSRLGLTEAVALDGSLRIDRYASQTQDRADFGGHTYSDKAPGNSFLALPSFELLRATGQVDGRARSQGVWRDRLLLWLLRALTGGLAFCAVLLLGRHAAEVAAPGAGLLVACTLGLGTIALPLAATTFSHLGAGALAFGGFLIARSRSRFAVATAGACAGAAVSFDYTAAVLLVIVGAYVVWHSRAPAGLAAFAAGAVVPFALLATYNALAFGSPRHFSYRYEHVRNHPALQHHGLFGVDLPTAMGVLRTLAGHRGLFVVSPVSALALVGLALLWRRGARAEAATCALATVALIGVAAGYFDPYGGLSPGPRYASAAIPFLGLGLAEAYQRWPTATAALAVLSVGGALYQAGTYGPNFDWATVWWWLGLPRYVGMAIVVGLVATAVAAAVPDVTALVRASRRGPMNASREVAA